MIVLAVDNHYKTQRIPQFPYINSLGHLNFHLILNAPLQILQIDKPCVTKSLHLLLDIDLRSNIHSQEYLINNYYYREHKMQVVL